MNLSFVDKFVHKQLDVLPSPTQEIRKTNKFINEVKKIQKVLGCIILLSIFAAMSKVFTFEFLYTKTNDFFDMNKFRETSLLWMLYKQINCHKINAHNIKRDR